MKSWCRFTVKKLEFWSDSFNTLRNSARCFMPPTSGAQERSGNKNVMFPWNILGSLDDSYMNSAAFLKNSNWHIWNPTELLGRAWFHLFHGVSVLCLGFFLPLLWPDIWRAEMMISRMRRTFFGFRSIFLSLPDFPVKCSWSSTQPPTELCM